MRQDLKFEKNFSNFGYTRKSCKLHTACRNRETLV